MAINKTINKRTNTHGAMRNCIEYVLRQDKTSELLTYVTGPYCHDEINYDLVYRTFLEEKKISHFVTYKNNLFKILFGTCILIFLIGAFIAIPALDIVYGTNLKQYQTSFVVLLLGGIASTFSTVCDNILTIFRKQHFLVISFIVGYIVSILTAKPLVSKFEIFGASLSFLCAMIAWLLASLVIYFVTNPYIIFRRKKIKWNFQL